MTAREDERSGQFLSTLDRAATTAARACRLLLVLLFAAALAGGAGPAAAAAVAPERVDRAVKRVLQDKSIQGHLPGHGAAQPPRVRSRPAPDLSVGRGLGAFMKLVLWGVVIAAGALLLYFIARELASFRRGRGRAEFVEAQLADDGAAGDGDEPPRDDRLAEADRLAAGGAFGEAIHTLLTHSLKRLEAIGEGGVGRSMTGREMLRRLSVTKRARELLSALVGASELAHFGGRPADAKAYASCRTAYTHLAAEAAPAP